MLTFIFLKKFIHQQLAPMYVTLQKIFKKKTKTKNRCLNSKKVEEEKTQYYVDFTIHSASTSLRCLRFKQMKCSQVYVLIS